MNKSCEALLQYFPSLSKVEDLHSTYIANCALNSVLSYTAIMLNILTIHAIRKTSSLRKTLKTLLLSLAVSDVGVGLLVQPFYISLLVEWLENSVSCASYMTFHTIQCLFTSASFSNVVAVSVDRFLAIHLHLRYQELVTHKRVVAVVISIWVLSGFLPMAVFWIQDNFFFKIKLSLGIFGVLLTTVAYIKIYLAVRRHKNEILALQVQQVAGNDEVAIYIRLIKSAVGVFYIYLVFLICNLPFFISLVALNISDPSINLKRFLLYSWTVMFLNSSLNPVIYCWKMRHIQHAIIDILRNLSWLRNRALY